MSTPDQKPLEDTEPPSDPSGSASTDSAMALGATIVGEEKSGVTPAATMGKPSAVDLVSDGLTLPQASKSSGPLPKHIEETLNKGTRHKLVEDELPRGASLGRYIVLSCLGAGGMGVVYAAYDPELDRKVAIKLLRTDASGSDASQARVRLLREAQAMARLQHPQVIAIYDVGTIKDQVFIAMEFVDGSTLTQWLKDQPRTIREILDVFTLAGRGLAAAHAVGLVHRDFKPDNVLVGKDGQVRVTDFGLARSVNQSDEYARLLDESPDAVNSQHLSVNLTRTGALMGTPRYMAPEQYSGAKTDPRTDQFSFCVALYEGLYGVAPFAGDTITTLGFNVVQGNVMSPPPDTRLPTWMRQVLLRGLNVTPSDRHADMDSLLAALNRERSGVPRLWIATAAVIVLVLAGNLFLHLRREDRESPCRGSESHLTGIWDETRKRDLKTKILLTGKSYAADAWQRTEEALDSYTDSWVKMRTAACLATVHGDQVPAIFELRRRCLDERMQDVKSFTDILADAEDSVVEHASTAVHDLPSLGLCADIDALKAPPPLPENPKDRAVVEQLNGQLVELRNLQRFGRYGVVIEKAQKLTEEAQAVKYVPVLAEALYLLGQVEERAGMARQAEGTFVRAAAAAMQSNKQAMLAETWIHLTALTGYRLNQPEKAESWAMLADAALDVLSPNDADPLHAQLDLARCRVETSKHAYDRAITYCQQSLTRRSRLFGNSSSEMAEVLHTLASIYRREENVDQAMRYYLEALDVEQKQLGGLHPDIASELRGMGILLRDQRRHREAQDYFSRALGIVQKSLGPDHIRTSDFYLLSGINLLYQNRVGEAQKQLQRCFEIRELAGEGELERRAEAAYFLGEALARLGRYREALSTNQIGLELAERDPNRKEVRVAYNLHAIGAIYYVTGRSSEAIPYLERALSIRQNQREEDRKLALNRLAETQFALAQAMWNIARGPARKRATELARLAQANYTDSGNKPENDLSAVTAWLAAGPVKPPELIQASAEALGFGPGTLAVVAKPSEQPMAPVAPATPPSPPPAAP